MSFGLRVFNESGILVLDSLNLLTRQVVSFMVVPNGQASGSVYVPELIGLLGTPWLVSYMSEKTSINHTVPVVGNISGHYFNWTCWTGAGTLRTSPTRIIIGVY